MSVFVQEVLSLLRRNFVKTSLNPTDDYFQFVRKGALSRARTSAGGFAPQGQSLLISAGSWLCSQTGPKGLGRFASVVKESGEEAGVIPMFWLKQGQCNWHSLKDSLLTQDSAESTIYVGRPKAVEASLVVSDKAYIPKLNAGAIGDPGRIPFALPSPNFGALAGELDSNVNFTFKEIAGNPPSAMFTVGSGVSSSFGVPQVTPPLTYDPATNVRIYSNLLLDARVYDRNQDLGVGPTGGNPQGVGGMLLRSRADGTVQWTTGSAAGLPDLQFGELIVGYQNPTPAPGTIVPAVGSFTGGAIGVGNVNEVLVSGGPNGMPTWAPNPGIGGIGTNLRIAMFTPDGVTISNSLMVQDGDGVLSPATTVTNDGKLKLLDVPLDATAPKVLVLNETSNIVGYRDTFVTGTETIYRVPLWSPDGKNLQSSILIQSDFIQPPSNYPSGQTNPYKQQNLTNDGNLINEGVVTLKTLAVNNSAPKILVVDSNGLVGYRDASTIGIGTVTSVSGGTSQFINTNVTNPTTTPSVTSTLSATGSPSASTFLRGDNTWAPAGTGTIAGGGTHKRLPLYTPDGTTIKDSLLSQDNDVQPGSGGFSAQVLTNDGKLINKGEVEIETVNQNDELDQVLVRDPLNNGLLKYRSALSIGGGVKGWDAVPDNTGTADWDVILSNGYMEVNSNPPAAFRAVRPNNIINAQEGYFVFVANRSDIPLNFLVFTGVNGSGPQTVRTTWSGDQTLGFPYTPTAQTGGFWASGTAVKFHYILRVEGGVETIWWDACCEIPSTNSCPVSQNVSFITNEDTAIGPLQMPSTDVDGDPLIWTVVQPPVNEGVVTFDQNTGVYTFTPAANWYGTGTFTFTTNDGICDSNVATVTYNVLAQCDEPQFAVSNGLGNACGAASVHPVFTGVVGDTYTWVGDYCDVDNPNTDITLNAEYSLDNGSTWTSGLPTGTTLQKDVPSAYQFTFFIGSPGVQALNTTYKFTLTDDQVGCSSQYQFAVGAIAEKLQNWEIQIESFVAQSQISRTRTPYGINTNLGMLGAKQNQSFTDLGVGSIITPSFPAGSGYPPGTQNAATTGGGNNDCRVTIQVNPGGQITSIDLNYLTLGSGYAVNDVLTIVSGSGTGATFTVATIGMEGPYSATSNTTGLNWTNYQGIYPGATSQNITGTQYPLWSGGVTPIRGQILKYRSTVPSNMNLSGISNNKLKNGIIASGGTYPGVAGGATFQLLNMVASSPNPNPGNREIFVFAENVPNNSSISLGQTIIFSAATLDTAFAGDLGAGFNFTGDLICTITQEDITTAPRAIDAIQLAMSSGSTHGCNEGGLKMMATITLASGSTKTFLIGRASVSNTHLINTPDRRYTLDTWEPPCGYINTGGACNGTAPWSWTRPTSQGGSGTGGVVNKPWVIDKQYIDMSRRGLTHNQVNSIWNNNKSYTPNKSIGVNYSTYAISGVRVIPDSVLTQIATLTNDGEVDLKVIGDTWGNAQLVGAEGTVTVTTIGAGGTITGATLTTSGGTYNSMQAAPIQGTNLDADFICTLGSGTGARIRFNISGDTTTSGGIFTPGETLVSVNSITEGGTGYQVGDVLQVSADHTWVSRTHGDAVTMRLFQRAPNQVRAVGNPGGINTGYLSPQQNLTTTVSPAGGVGCKVNITVSGGSITSVTIPNGERGSGYNVGDILTIQNVNSPGTENGTVEITSVANNQEEIYNGGKFNTGVGATQRAFKMSTGTTVRVNVFTGAVQIL